MLEQAFVRCIEHIHNSTVQLVLEFAGAGSLGLYWLHSVAGSSRTILEATDRYASESLIDLLGHTPQHFVSQATAEAMAERAFQRAMRLSDGDSHGMGVGCTATIATDRSKRGDHSCWVAVQDRNGVTSYGVTLTKGARDRTAEERVVGQLLIQAIAAASRVNDDIPIDLIGGEAITTIYTEKPDPIAQLLDGTVRSVIVQPDGQRVADEPVQGLLLSGSFNPLHIGHEQLAQAATTMLKTPTSFELPILNADKPPLHYAEIERRLAQFRWRYPVVLSRAPLFGEKATLFPHCTFVIGYDTALRLIAPHYYGGETQRDEALTHIRERGCQFLVAGRKQNDNFYTLAELTIPVGFQDLFMMLPESAFRVDLSSSDIREQLHNQR
ncbi:MAG: hypothetical protein AAGF95_15950 [Chloroflexota bacterium]